MAQRISRALGALACVGAGIFMGAAVSRPAQADVSDVYGDLQLFAEVLSLVENEYVDDIDNEVLIHGAIRGMMAELDPHSVFLDAEEFATMREDTRGQYVGVGMELSVDDGRFVIGTVFEGGPSFDAGVQSGDVVVSVDGVDIAGMELGDVTEMFRATIDERGSIVRMVIERGAPAEVIEFDLVRDVVRIDAVSESMLAPGYGHIHIRTFQSNVGEELRDAIDQLESDHGGELQGLVLDLRSNPGGLLSEAISVADAFLSSGTIVSTRGRWVEDDDAWTARRANTRYNGPLVVLVNGSSASASEIVAGALQDNARGLVVGTQTFGKGSVQSILELSQGTGMKLTVSLYFTPSGHSIQNRGIAPDMVVESGSMPPIGEQESTPREADLDGRLENPEDEDDVTIFDISHIEDRQLHFAVQQLRAFSVFSGH